MSTKSERTHILDMIENGVITPAEGARLLEALAGEGETGEGDEATSAQPTLEAGIVAGPGEEADQASAAAQAPPSPGETWKRWWLIPLWVGCGVTVLGGALMLAAYQASGFGFWFGCAWVPFLLGVGIMALAWASRSSRWLHLRIHQKPGRHPERVALSFPLPLRPAAWFLRTFGKDIPPLQRTGLDELIRSLEKDAWAAAPFYLEVDEGENGEQVQVYIG